MKFGVVQFPGTWSDHDCYHVLSEVLKQETVINSPSFKKDIFFLVSLSIL